MSPIEKLMSTVGRFIGLVPPPCGHKWRPAMTSKGGARMCNICDEVQNLDDAMFYAYFGRMPTVPAQTMRAR